MMKLQGSDIANKGAAPRAVVVVQCPIKAVSHAIGIIEIIYEISYNCWYIVMWPEEDKMVDPIGSIYCEVWDQERTEYSTRIKSHS